MLRVFALFWLPKKQSSVRKKAVIYKMRKWSGGIFFVNMCAKFWVSRSIVGFAMTSSVTSPNIYVKNGLLFFVKKKFLSIKFFSYHVTPKSMPRKHAKYFCISTRSFREINVLVIQPSVKRVYAWQIGARLVKMLWQSRG